MDRFGVCRRVLLLDVLLSPIQVGVFVMFLAFLIGDPVSEAPGSSFGLQFIWACCAALLGIAAGVPVIAARSLRGVEPYSASALIGLGCIGLVGWVGGAALALWWAAGRVRVSDGVLFAGLVIGPMMGHLLGVAAATVVLAPVHADTGARRTTMR